jgi:plastocyanin
VRQKSRISSSARLAAAAALAAALLVLPARAASEAAPTIEAEDPAHLWKPPSATIEPGGRVVFANPSTSVPHGIHWVKVPSTPSCEPSVPVGTGFAQSATNWSGSCTFATAGTYVFYCTVHGAAMSGSITVGAGGAPPGEPPPTPTTTTTTTTTPPPGTAPGGISGAPGSASGGAPAPGAPAALAALRLSAPRHGASVRGSLVVPAADAGGRLEVELFAARSALAAGGVRVGQLERGSLAAGPLRFSLRPSARAQRALRRRGRLALTVLVRLAAPSGGAGEVSRRVPLHR